MASQYLTTQTTSLDSTTPVPPSQARAAQIPLQSFSLPVFPQEAFSSGLNALILTADIKLDEYQSLLDQAFSIPDLPGSIQSLTLELFSLGYPPGFLKVLGEKLPHLKTVTIYSQLLAGTTTTSREDAVGFFREQKELREVHLLDVFGPSGFFEELAASVPESVRFLEVNFTYRHSDPGFLATLPKGNEMGTFVRKEMVGLTMCVSAPDITDDEDDHEGTEVGILPLKKGEGSKVVEGLVRSGGELAMLDITMFELAVGGVREVFDACGKLKVVGFTLGVEKGWKEVFDGISEKEVGIEVLEIVGVPGEGLVERIKAGGDAGLERGLVEKLGGSWKELKSVKVSLLRTNGEQWVREGEGWEKK